MSKEGSDKRDRDKEAVKMQVNRSYNQKQEEDMSLWGILIFGLIGASVTTYAITRIRRSVDWIYSQMSRSQRTNGRTFRSSFQEDSWKRYNKRMQEAHEEEMERLERIRRMQSVFNRERNKFNRSYESWQEHSHSRYHQQQQRNDWYWKAHTSSRDQSSNFKEPPRTSSRSSPLSHHYTVLGLDRRRTEPYTEMEIKAAFQAKAKQYHPDQNQENKEFAEKKFKELMVSYGVIKSERRDSK